MYRLVDVSAQIAVTPKTKILQLVDRLYSIQELPRPASVARPLVTLRWRLTRAAVARRQPSRLLA